MSDASSGYLNAPRDITEIIGKDATAELRAMRHARIAVPKNWAIQQMAAYLAKRTVAIVLSADIPSAAKRAIVSEIAEINCHEILHALEVEALK